MNYFSKKTSTILTILSIFAISISAAIILFSSQLIDITYTILSQNVFHREFSIDKWLPSINSFFMVPMFGVISINALIFYKYPAKNKVILLSVLLGIAAIMIAYTTLTTSHMHVNGDTSSELWLGKECILQHTFWPRTWFYSTEFRLLYTQIFTTIGFLFTDSWNGVKSFQSICCCAVLFFAMWYLLNQLSIKTFWLKFFTCILTVLPWSTLSWYVGAGWTYYIPHAAISLVYVASYIKLVCNTDKVRHPTVLTTFFYCWAFLAGLSTIRYILIFVFPLAVAMIILEARDKNNASIADFRGFWINNKAVFHSVAGLFASGFGYIANNLVLQKIWSFSEWNTQGYDVFGKVSPMDIWGGIIRMFGYTDRIAVFSPSGVLNMLVYVALILFIAFMVSTLKNKCEKTQKVVMVFFIATMTFNIFQYIHVDFIPRYFYPVIIYVFPIIAILLSNTNISGFRRYMFGVSWGILICTSAFAAMQYELTTDGNKDKYPVLEFLKKNDYDFGYGTYWETTAITYLSNGTIQMGNLYKAKKDGEHVYITPTYKYDHFETPNYLYDDENHKDKKVFLMVTQDQYEISSDLRIFETGELVYSDENYRIYNYENHSAFKNGF